MEAESSEGMAEKIFAKYQKDRKLPASVFITRDLDENAYLAQFFKKHNITADARSFDPHLPDD